MKTKRLFFVSIASLALFACSNDSPSDSPSDKEIEDIIDNNISESIDDSDVFEEACKNPIFSDAPQCN